MLNHPAEAWAQRKSAQPTIELGRWRFERRLPLAMLLNSAISD